MRITLVVFVLFGALLAAACSSADEVAVTPFPTTASIAPTPTPTAIYRPVLTPSVTSNGGWDPVCGVGCVPGELLIHFSGETPPASVQTILDQYGAVPINQSLGPGVWTIQVETEKTDDLFATLNNRSDVTVERVSSGIAQESPK